MPEKILKHKPVGYAKVMADAPISQGDQATEILNWDIDTRGKFLESKVRVMPLVPTEWQTFQPPEFSDVRGMVYTNQGLGSKHEVLFLTGTGVFRYTPWERATRGTREQFGYNRDGTPYSVVPQGKALYPPSIAVVGRFVFFTFCDGGCSWVWDGIRVRPLGYTRSPPPLSVQGPQRDEKGEANEGGFSVTGRVGSVSDNWTRLFGLIERAGMDRGFWTYWQVWENEGGAYSPMSPVGTGATTELEITGIVDWKVTAESLRRKMWLSNIVPGPVGTVARVLLRTYNLARLPDGSLGEPRFLHRIPHNVGNVQYIDDIPDGELGAMWGDRAPIPEGVFFLHSFGGSMVYMRSTAYPSRIWWSEQESGIGPIPESMMKGAWQEVFPETGPITGGQGVRMSTGDQSAALLICKARAIHFMNGRYPDWSFGTLRMGAGLAGPGLIQSLPDGTVLLYGASTFWLIDENGVCHDVGRPLRKLLRRINTVTVRMGTSYVDEIKGQAHFFLPFDDSLRPDRTFTWDYHNKGWRRRDDQIVDAVLAINGGQFTLMAGTHNAVRTVYVWGRGYAAWSYPAVTATYRTGWCTMDGAETSPQFGSTWRITDLLVVGEERSSGTATVKVFEEWALVQAIADDTLPAAHPEHDNIPYYGAATYGAANTNYRTLRYYHQRAPADEHTTGVFQVEIQTTAVFALMGIDAYGVKVGGPTNRAPEGNA